MMKTRRSISAMSVSLLALVLGLPAVAAVPEPVSDAHYTAISYNQTNLSWVATSDAASYVIYVNGELARTTTATSRYVDITLGRILGPADTVEIAAKASDGTLSSRTLAEYWPYLFVYIPGNLIHFAQGVTTLNGAGLATVRNFGAFMRTHGFDAFKATGHNAGLPGAAGAYEIGKIRAKNVMRAVSGVVPGVEHVVSSWGNAYPVATISTAAGLDLNRRVELSVR